MEDDNSLWNAFSQSGSIEDYLLYKKSYEKEKENEEIKCQISPQEVL